MQCEENKYIKENALLLKNFLEEGWRRQGDKKVYLLVLVLCCFTQTEFILILSSVVYFHHVSNEKYPSLLIVK